MSLGSSRSCVPPDYFACPRSLPIVLELVPLALSPCTSTPCLDHLRWAPSSMFLSTAYVLRHTSVRIQGWGKGHPDVPAFTHSLLHAIGATLCPYLPLNYYLRPLALW